MTKNVVFLFVFLYPSIVAADCMEMPQGEIVEVQIAKCEAVVAEKNQDVKKYAGELYETWDLKRLYTGALITDDKGTKWMYPSQKAEPCRLLTKGKLKKFRAYYTCCDTGRWGKCVFGGSFLTDTNGKPINAFQ